MSTELLDPQIKTLQTRETYVEVRNSPLGVVQVADELGFAYLEGDIDFGAVGKNEIYQNIKFIILTEYYSVPLDREFGMDYSMVDKPMRVAEMILAQEVAMKISLYEPRAQFREILYAEDMLNGKLSPSVKVALLTSNELPSTIDPTIGTPGAAPLVIIEEIDLPGFYQSMIDLARVPGPPGPTGAQGEAATIEVGTTTTGDPGTEAFVINVGNAYAAIFDFVIPKGEKGDQGTGITIKGTVPNSGALPSTGNQPGDMWITADTGHGWTWDGDSWVDAGPIQGPPGPANVLSVAATNTGAPGTAANVSISGTSPAQDLTFTIPRGDVGSQGVQGIQGIQGIQGEIGDIGPQGNVGATGPSNVLSVSGTTTGAPGTNANVSIAGTSPAQSLAFTIPRGDVGAQGIKGDTGNTGAQGSQGIQGVQGAQGANAFTLTTANFDVPAEGASVLVTLVDASWVTIGQMVAVQTAGGSLADAHSFEVTAKVGNQVTLKNVGTSWAINNGDMMKAVYDTNSDGIVERAKLSYGVGAIPILTYQDHFLTGSDASYTNWTMIQGTGAAKAQGTSVADHPGIYQLSTGTQAGAAATGYGFITAGNAYILGATGIIVFRAVFKAPTTKPTSTAANLSKIYLGMGTQPANGTYPGANFCGFVFDPSSGMANAANNWGILTRKASANTYTDTGFAYSTTNWNELSFWLDATGVWFQANVWGSAVPAYGTAITSNIPLATTPLCMVLHCVNGPSGTTSYQSFIDLWEVAYQPPTAVPMFRGASMILDD